MTAPTIAPKNQAIPTNADDLETFLVSPEAKPYFKDAKALSQFIAEYAKVSTAAAPRAFSADDLAQIQDQAKTVLVDMLKDQADGGAIKRLNLAPGQSQGETTRRMLNRAATGFNPLAAGAKLDEKFSSSGEFFKNVWQMDPKQAPSAPSDVVTKMAEIQNAYSSTVPAGGGFLIPETLRAQLLQVALEEAIVRPRATVVPMESLMVPFPMVDSTSNASSVFGGMVAYWTEEAAAMTASEARFGRVELIAKTLTGYAEVPTQLMQDSIISFAAFVDNAWPKAIAWYEDKAFIKGSGVGQPLGFIGASNTAGIAITKEAGQPAASVVVENIVKMYARMLPSSLNKAVWLVSPQVWTELFLMALSVGTGGGPVYLVNGIQGAPSLQILGRPVITTEKLSQLGTRGDIAFVDLSYYLIGDRQAMSADTSDHFKFNQNMTAFRIIQRVDGRPWIQSAITPENSGPTLSPFVEIETRS